MQIKFQFVLKSMYLDRPGIVDRMDRKTVKVLAYTGKRTRTYMQRNMRYRQRASPVGSFPSAHRESGALLRKHVGFGFDIDQTRSLIVGPELLPRSDKAVLAAGQTVPLVVNVGGVIMRRKIYDPKKNQIRRVKHVVAWRHRPRPFVSLTLPYASSELARQMTTVPLI